MKKVLIGSAFAVMALVVLSSCKKDYTCTCTVLGTTSASEIKDSKKKDAEDACSALETTAKIVDPAASCSI